MVFLMRTITETFNALCAKSSYCRIFFHKGKNRAVPKVQLRKGCCYSPSCPKWTKEYAVEIVRMAQ